MTLPSFEVRLTRGAEGDLEKLHAYLTEQGAPEAADRLLDAILEKVEALERSPHRGSVPAELAGLGIRSFRQLALPPYRIIYQVVGQEVFVLLIADGRRDMQALLEWRLLEQ
ncbi:MAG TPA: type II toxin-antitoxin system RelE/ParE family toxin [Allosphingosinicella sp.]|nr:type II toxin-antitoxin system RelE/ParE family toxin [Allosphingosinicella sp.]